MARKPTPKRTSAAGPEAQDRAVACPSCGMRALPPRGAVQARCRACGAVVRLGAPDAPATPDPPPPDAAAGPAARRIDVGLAVGLGFAAPLAVAAAFFAGHRAIDQPSPDGGTAAFWLLLAVVGALATAWSLWRVSAPVTGTAWLAAASAVPTLWFAVASGTSYADEDFFEALFVVYYVAPVLAVYVAVMLVLLAVQAGRGDASPAARAIHVGGVGFAAGFGLAAAYLLATLGQQMEEARQAHRDAPAWGLLATGGLLLAAGAARRRRA